MTRSGSGTTPDDRPQPEDGLVTVPVGDEAVVLNGWRDATALSPSAAQFWARLDGRTSLTAIADDLADTFAADRAVVLSDIIRLTQELTANGLLRGVRPTVDEIVPDIVLEPARVTTDVGDRVDDLELTDSSGRPARLLPDSGQQCLLINWSPHCGYCASILGTLARLDPQLSEAGVPPVLFAYGSAEASRTMADLDDWHPRTLIKPPHEIGPFLGHGTPAAFHLDADGTLRSPAASGTDDVLRLAATLAGAEISEVVREARNGARYLLDPGGSCAPGSGSEPITKWAGTRVYRIDDHHVGLRYTSWATAVVLDDLFVHDVVDDAGAGHIYTVALAAGGTGAAGDEPPHGTNLLALGSQVLVRSRFPGRVLRALLWWLDDQMEDDAPSAGPVRVNATAVLTPVGAVLLQPGLYTLEEDLQPAFARHGIAFVDVPEPLVDLATAELVVSEPVVGHDARVLEAILTTSALDAAEPAPVGPGRFPLVGWGVVREADRAVTLLSPAQAAAATLSFVRGTDDPPARVLELADLFQRIGGFGLWYHSEAQLADAVAEAVGLA